MSASGIQARRDAIIREHGPWTNYNLRLAEGVYTIGERSDGMAEQRVDRVVQAVTDAVGPSLDGLRVLDLACYEGAFGIAFAERGARVLALEAREEHVVKTGFAAEVRELGDRFEVRQADVRSLNREEHGEFDVVLCLGILYHLDAPDCFDFALQVADVCTGLAIVETQVSLTSPAERTWRGRTYAGKLYPENVAQPGAAADNTASFWPTRASLLNLMSDVGFTSVSELLTPVIPELAAFRDHVTLVCRKGERVADPGRWPERLPFVAHPTQGRRYSLLERLARLRGGGIPAVFEKPQDGDS